MKGIVFCGTALVDLRAFPKAARREAGFQLDQVQYGLDPADWKPMASIGSGVREIRVRSKEGAFRIIYVAVLADAIYVLHCFQKRSQRTSRLDLEIARRRLKAVKGERG